MSELNPYFKGFQGNIRKLTEVQTIQRVSASIAGTSVDKDISEVH